MRFLDVRATARVLLWAVAGTVVGGTFASHIRTPEWWVRTFDYPRPQLAVLALVAAGVLPAVEPSRRAGRLGALALLAAAGWQAWQISAYTPLAPRQTRMSSPSGDDAATVSLLISNVYMENREAGRLAALVDARQPDLVLLLEPDQRWIDALSHLHAAYPHRVLHPLGNTYGIALYSRLELVGPEVQFLVEPEIPSISTEVRLRSGPRLRLHAIHPRPPRPGSDTDERDAELVIVGRRAARERGPVIVAGDLNDVAWSHTTRLFQRLSELLDPRVGRGFYNTFPVSWPLLRFPIDQIFHTPDFTLDALEVLPDIGSDHFPVYVRLRYAPQAAARQPAPTAEAEDHSEATEIVDEARD